MRDRCEIASSRQICELVLPRKADDSDKNYSDETKNKSDSVGEVFLSGFDPTWKKTLSKSETEDIYFKILRLLQEKDVANIVFAAKYKWRFHPYWSALNVMFNDELSSQQNVVGVDLRHGCDTLMDDRIWQAGIILDLLHRGPGPVKVDLLLAVVPLKYMKVMDATPVIKYLEFLIGAGHIFVLDSKISFMDNKIVPSQLLKDTFVKE